MSNARKNFPFPDIDPATGKPVAKPKPERLTLSELRTVLDKNAPEKKAK